jgi:hypothetical protein
MEKVNGESKSKRRMSRNINRRHFVVKRRDVVK